MVSLRGTRSQLPFRMRALTAVVLLPLLLGATAPPRAHHDHLPVARVPHLLDRDTDSHAHVRAESHACVCVVCSRVLHVPGNETPLPAGPPAPSISPREAWTHDLPTTQYLRQVHKRGPPAAPDFFG